MTWAEAAVVVGSLSSLVAAGWGFLNRSLYRDFEEKDQIAQVIASPTLLGKCRCAVHCSNRVLSVCRPRRDIRLMVHSMACCCRLLESQQQRTYPPRKLT